jgi:hypothetical protein
MLLHTATEEHLHICAIKPYGTPNPIKEHLFSVFLKEREFHQFSYVMFTAVKAVQDVCCH